METASNPTSVLLVDDAHELRLLYEIVLSQHPEFKVVGHAASGEEAIECARRLQPDIVMLDVVMPGMGGLEALPAIKEASPESSVYMLSGYDADALDPNPMGLGAAGVWTKGCTPDAIIDRLRACVRARALA
jgi:DNA-binding NarL/FixJ family response regulator